MNSIELFKALSAPFDPNKVSWRIGAQNPAKDKGMALAYIDARDVQDRFNQVCGPFGWQSDHVVAPDGKKVTCRIGVQNPETKEWIWRSDGAGETDVEGEKGSYSDSLKRAAVSFGVGRYLYDLDSPWVEIKDKKITPDALRKLRHQLATASNLPTDGVLYERPTYQERTAANIGHGKMTPEAWQMEAIKVVKACATDDELTAWSENNAAALVKLRNTSLDLHKELIEAMTDRHEQLARAA